MPQFDPINDKISSFEARRKELQAKKGQLLPYLILFPLIVLLATALLVQFPPAIFIGTGLAIFASVMYYHYKVGKHFSQLKGEVKNSLIEEFMDTYHPEVAYNYSQDKQAVEPILKSVRLIKADKYREEDVLTGTYNDSSFYFSEIRLLDEYRDSKGKSKTRTIFDGLLFNLRLPNRNFPLTRIQSKRRLSQMIFGDFVKDEEHDFWYETEDEEHFRDSLHSLLPFIAHLRRQQGDIRMQLEGDQLTLIMSSDMALLDDPKLKMNRPFDDPEYKLNMAKQLNSLLFIVDAFANDLQDQEITDRLELKSLELADFKEKLAARTANL